MKKDNSLDKFVEKYPTYIEALDIIDDLKKQLERHNKYFNSFSCDSFDEFADFISTFMLTPHEEQTLIKDLEKQLKEKDKEIEKLNACVDFYKSYYISFNEKVINELEKVKEFVSRQLFITTKDCNNLDEAEAKGCNELREETIKEIDNQIKELKGEE